MLFVHSDVVKEALFDNQIIYSRFKSLLHFNLPGIPEAGAVFSGVFDIRKFINIRFKDLSGIAQFGFTAEMNILLRTLYPSLAPPPDLDPLF